MLLLSGESDFGELVSVNLLVLLQLLDFVSQLASSWLQEILECVVSSLDIDDGVLDVLFKSDNLGIVVIGSDIEVEL